MKVGAIVPAAGQGNRIGGPVPKQFLALNGKPLLHYVLSVFAECGVVNELVLAVPARELEQVRRDWLGFGGGLVAQVIAGGAQRQDSVYNGFKALAPDTDVVVVHDGVRPFLTAEMIRSTVEAAAAHGAAIAAIPVNDTLKQAGREGFVEKTVSRDGLWRVQTPQAFRYAALGEAFAHAAAASFYGTDEASLIEFVGRPVKIVPGSELNIKITRPEDFILGECIAKRR